MRLLPYGDRALLVEVDDDTAVAAWATAVRAALTATPRPADSAPASSSPGAAVQAGVIDIVPAARTVLVVVDPAVLPLDRLRGLLSTIDPADVVPDTGVGAAVVLDVRYDGADLAAVAESTGLSVAEVIARHGAATYTSAFCGFAPGFAYLTGLDPRLHLPRRATPRPRVPRGSVAIAAGYCGVYPNDMPGGWHLLGHTDAVLWDLARAEPALLAPGTTVRFRALSP